MTDVKKDTVQLPPPTDLAAEYAMGLLEGAELQKAAELLRGDEDFRAQVKLWQHHLAGMDEEIEPVTPPADQYAKIESRLFGQAEPQKAGILSSLGFWRAATFAMVGACAFLITAMINPTLLGLEPQKSTRGYIAALNAAVDKPTFLIRADTKTGELGIHTANLAKTGELVPELWLIDGQGTPRSLGLLSTDGSAALKLNGALLEQFKQGATLAVSLEPEGGAPEGKPTGPIIATGKIQEI